MRMIVFLSSTYDNKSIVPERCEERGDMTKIVNFFKWFFHLFHLSREEEQKIRDTGGYDW